MVLIYFCASAFHLLSVAHLKASWHLSLLLPLIWAGICTDCLALSLHFLVTGTHSDLIGGFWTFTKSFFTSICGIVLGYANQETVPTIWQPHLALEQTSQHSVFL